jgi:indole-3-glycerol phosphate synthase
MGFLAEIVTATGESLRDPSYGRNLPAPPPGPRPSLRAAIERDRGEGALLVEFKRFSPGQKDPRLPVRTVEEFVQATAPAGVAAYSCLATQPRFAGSPADVAALVRATRKPVLFKDFVLDRRQLDAAVCSGASAVLLIARLATEGPLKVPLSDLAEEAHARGLEVLLEFHDKTELSEAERVAADVYGVNARDLDSLRIARPMAEATLHAASEQGLRPLLGLSGVTSAEDARRLWSSGVDGILVGSAVARAADPAEFLVSLHRRPPRELA